MMIDHPKAEVRRSGPSKPAPFTSPRRFLEVLEDPWFGLIVDLQDRISVLTMEFWSRRGLRTLHLPITTSAVSSPMGLGSDSKPVEVDLFGVKTFLADSMQFMLEYGCRLCPAGCYYIMPSFRGEHPDETHLCQFFHSEAEIPGDLEAVIRSVEEYLAHLCAGILETYADALRKSVGDVSHLERLIASVPLRRLSFDEAAEILEADPRFVVRGEAGWRTLTRAGERELLSKICEFLWITHWDHLAVPFYQAFADEAGRRARNADLLFGAGEVIGSGERHRDATSVERALELHRVDAEPYRWYLDLRRHSPLQTSGFGMGIERFLLWVLQHDDIRDLQLLPRINGVEVVP